MERRQGVPSPAERSSIMESLFETPATTQGPTATASTGTSTSGASDANATDGQDVAATGNAVAGVSSAMSTDPLGTTASTAATEPTSSAGSANSENGQDMQQASKETSGGMSSGTKIGIGVGVGVGVAVLIALLAAFLILRRRRSRFQSNNPAEQVRGQPAMESAEPALAGASALGRSPSYRSNNRSSYHSLSPTTPPPMPETAAADPIPEATKGTIPAQPTIIPPSQQSLPRDLDEHQTPRGRPSMEAEIITSPGGESLRTPAPPYDDTPSPIDDQPSRPISPVSPVSSMGSRPPSLRRSLDG